VVDGIDEVNPKVRDGTLDVKVLIGTERGFERWDPWLKEPFPVEAPVLRSKLFPRLRIAAPEMERDAYTAALLLDEVVAAHPLLTAVEVAKRRQMFTTDACTAETADVVIEGRHVQTVAIESVQVDVLSTLRRELGLDADENVSYPRAIKRLLFPARRGA
jgi:hypothetical protein